MAFMLPLQAFVGIFAFANLLLAQGSSSVPVVAVPASGVTTLKAGGSTGFIHARKGSLYSEDGKLWNFASFNSPHLLSADPFSVEDSMRTLIGFGRPVSRTYTLSIASINIPAASANIQGWDATKGDWIYNEAPFVKFDKMLDLASKYGVKVVHPIINQDYGSQDSNFAGNWADLIRLRYGLASYNDTKAIDWWTDKTMIDSYKLIIAHLLNRRNTVNGRRYGSDPTFLAFETGNEMNYLGFLPPPGSWTVTIAKHIKSLASKTMVMDGSLSRNDTTAVSWAIEALKAPEVDLFSYHYYRDSPPPYDYHKIVKDAPYVRSFGKTFIAGEHGFYATAAEFTEFFQLQQSSGAAGSMVWSIRPHATNGGFLTHGEGDGIFSYHAPGWSPPVVADFDPLEKDVIHITYAASYRVLGKHVPSFPVPNAPVVSVVNGTTGLTWQGAAWAEHYEVWSFSHSTHSTPFWKKVATRVLDNVDAGGALYPLNGTSRATSYTMRGISVEGKPGPFSNVVQVK